MRKIANIYCGVKFYLSSLIINREINRVMDKCKIYNSKKNHLKIGSQRLDDFGPHLPSEILNEISKNGGLPSKL